jgi:dihydrofolate reductase
MMRKLKLQVQITADGFVAGPEGQLNWLASVDKDERLLRFLDHLTDTSDTILLGRKLTDGFVKYWEKLTKPTGHRSMTLERINPEDLPAP